MRRALKSRIILLYGKEKKFAAICGRNTNWLSRIISGVQNPTPEEKRLILEKLNAENQEYLFLDWEK